MMKRTPIPKKADVRAYRQLWRIVDGAVADAFGMHPDYLSSKGLRVARRSVVKRVVGSVNGYVEQSTRGRSGAEPAAETEGVVSQTTALPRCSPLGTEAACTATTQLAGWDSGSGRLSVPDWQAWTDLMRDEPI